MTLCGVLDQKGSIFFFFFFLEQLDLFVDFDRLNLIDDRYTSIAVWLKNVHKQIPVFDLFLNGNSDLFICYLPTDLNLFSLAICSLE